MKVTRRDTLKSAVLAAGGAAFGSSFVESAGAADNPSAASVPKRFVFFLYSNGFHPDHVCPQELKDTRKTDKLIDVELGPYALPKWTEPLEKFKDQMTILQGVNGRHCGTSHGTPFGCLAGLKKGKSPKAQTIDYALGNGLPPTPLPMLGIGLSQLSTMQATPITYSSSAAGASRPVPMFSNPGMAFQNIFGCVADEKSQSAFLAETDWFGDVLEDSGRIRKRLGGAEAAKFDIYLEGLRQIQRQRRDLMKMKETLAKFKPDRTEAFDNPEHSGQWWEAGIDVGVAALQAGVTNVLTIDAGLSGPDGMPLDTFKLDWPEGAREPNKSHDIGHWPQNSPGWLSVRHYSLIMLERIIQSLAEFPEPGGKGSMLDNTLIVYTSDSGEVQHSHGNHWPFLLIGNLGGRIRSGRYIQFPTWGSMTKTPNSSYGEPVAHAERPHDGRTINALWTTLLHAAGAPVDGFNLKHAPTGIDKLGPMEELLA
jgi:hypothetical protein